MNRSGHRWEAFTTRLLALVLAISCAMMWTGCAPIFVGGAAVSVARAPSKHLQASSVNPKVSVVARANALPPLQMYPWSPPMSDAIPLQTELESAVQKVTKDRGLFRSVALVREAEADVVIEIDAFTRARPLGPGGVVHMALHLLTFTVIPVPRSNDVILTGKVMRPDGTIIRSYRLAGAITQVNELLFIFIPFGWVLTPERAASHVFEELVGALYRQIEADGSLSVH